MLAGSSAGAMVAVRLDRAARASAATTASPSSAGSAWCPATLAVPHWSGGSSRGDWLRAVEAVVPSEVRVLGLPEQSGVLVDGDRLTAVGAAPTELWGEDRVLRPGAVLAAD